MRGRTARIKVRVGLPKTGGALVAAARRAGYPVLFSANAFAKAYPLGHERQGEFRGFSMPDLQQLAGMDAALDSAGFVAAAKYGDYRWRVEDYMRLAAAFPWAWYASMDYCCEPQVSDDRLLRMLRIAATCQLYARCSAEADRLGIQQPMPVIQGWHAHEYATCIDWMPLAGRSWPDIVGVGSVCRRSLDGEHGIRRILQVLDEKLPAHVRLHLFGVKSKALEALGPHPRIASMDSMAWDFGARQKRRTGRDMAFRIECMREWAERQHEVARRIEAVRALQDGESAPQDPQMDLFSLEDPPRPARLFELQTVERLAGFMPSDVLGSAMECLAQGYCDLILEGQIDYHGAVSMANWDVVVVASVYAQAGQAMDDEAAEHIESMIGLDFAERWRARVASGEGDAPEMVEGTRLLREGVRAAA